MTSTVCGLLSTVYCVYCLLCLLSTVSTVYCVYCLLCILSTVFCVYCLLCLLSTVYTVYWLLCLLAIVSIAACCGVLGGYAGRLVPSGMWCGVCHGCSSLATVACLLSIVSVGVCCGVLGGYAVSFYPQVCCGLRHGYSLGAALIGTSVTFDASCLSPVCWGDHDLPNYMGWKTCKCYHETDELPTPTQEKIGAKSHMGHFFSHSK